jgi:hypothetical protein
MDVLVPVYNLVKSCYGAAASSKILLVRHKDNPTNPSPFKTPRLSTVENAFSLLSLSSKRQHPILTLVCNMLSSIEVQCADGTTLGFLFLYCLIKYASKQSQDSYLIQLLHSHDKFPSAHVQNVSSLAIETKVIPEPYLLPFHEVLQLLREELKTMVISVSSADCGNIIHKLCYSLLNTKLDVVLSEELSVACSQLILHCIRHHSQWRQREECYDILLVRQLPHLDSKIPIVCCSSRFYLTETFVLFQSARNLSQPLVIVNPRILVTFDALENNELFPHFHSVAERSAFIEEQHTKVREKVEKIMRTGASILISTASISGFAATLLAKNGILCFHNVPQNRALQIAQITGATVIPNVDTLALSEENKQIAEVLGTASLAQYLSVARIPHSENETSSKPMDTSRGLEEDTWALVIALRGLSGSKNETTMTTNGNDNTSSDNDSHKKAYGAKYLSLWLRGGRNLKKIIDRVTRAGLYTYNSNYQSFCLLPGGGKWQLNLARRLQQLIKDQSFSETTADPTAMTSPAFVSSNSSGSLNIVAEAKRNEIPFFLLAVSVTIFSLLGLYQYLWKEETPNERLVNDIFDSYPVIDNVLSLVMATAETLLRIDQIITPHLFDMSPSTPDPVVSPVTSQTEPKNQSDVPFYKEEEYIIHQQLTKGRQVLMTQQEQDRIKERETELARKEEQRIRQLEQMLKFSRERLSSQ